MDRPLPLILVHVPGRRLVHPVLEDARSLLESDPSRPSRWAHLPLPHRLNVHVATVLGILEDEMVVPQPCQLLWRGPRVGDQHTTIPSPVDIRLVL